MSCDLHGTGQGNLAVAAAIPSTNFYERGLIHPFLDDEPPKEYVNLIDDEMDDKGLVHCREIPELCQELNLNYIEETLFDCRIAEIHVTPITFRDPPLLNFCGRHQPYALRSIFGMEAGDGTAGLGENYGTRPAPDGLGQFAPAPTGLPVNGINGLWPRARETLANTPSRIFLRVVSAVEVAGWDAFGKLTGHAVCDLLGGQVREIVPFFAHIFYKPIRHADGGDADAWGQALGPELLVEQERRMVDEHWLRALKRKAGILEPELEIADLDALRRAFPDAPLRIDPNGAKHVYTILELLPRLEGLLEYLEDPIPGIPLATNMCVVRSNHLPPAVARCAMRVIWRTTTIGGGGSG